MNFSSNFQDDLKSSDKGINNFCFLLESKGYSDIKTNNDGRYDIICLSPSYWKSLFFHKIPVVGKQTTFEVKEDKKYKITGNIVIEIESRGKPSGICSTISDYWIQLLEGEYFGIETSLLKKIIKNKPIVKGGDNNTSKLYLIRFDEIKHFFCKW